MEPIGPDRVALVTGANRGIGYAVAGQLADLGIQVLLASRDPAAGARAAGQLSTGARRITPVALDVTSPPDVEAVRNLVQERFGRLDILINNAAVLLDDDLSIFDLDEERLRLTLETNLFGAFRLCQAFIPLMRRHRYGRVVNVSSEMGQLAEMGRGSAAYRISKTALNAMTRIMAVELRRVNIKVNAVCPGWVHTNMGGPSAPLTPDEGADSILWLATLPDQGPTGGFFQEWRQIPW